MINFNKFILPSTSIGKVYKSDFIMFVDMYAPGENPNKVYMDLGGDKYERDVGKKMLYTFRTIAGKEPKLIDLFRAYRKYNNSTLFEVKASYVIINPEKNILRYYDEHIVGIDKLTNLMYDKVGSRGYIYNFYRRRFSYNTPKYKELMHSKHLSAPAAFLKTFIHQTKLDMIMMLCADIDLNTKHVLSGPIEINGYFDFNENIVIDISCHNSDLEDVVACAGNTITSHMGLSIDCKLKDAITNII